jgi:phenylpropionate dioxygenase-like ring-hydroxylating dioxygenase large terminal subunit
MVMSPEGRSMFDPQLYANALRPPLQADSLPAWCYTSEEFHRREIDQIFCRGWICIGREDALPETGDYRAFEFCGKKLIVIRGQDGRINVLDNICRHRGTLLLAGSGRVKVILCPFHHWGYGLDGVLRGAPTMEQTEGFDKADFGLKAYEVASWNGFIFMRLTPGGASLAETMGDMDRLVAPYNLGDMRLARQRSFTVECNWKLFLDVFMEDYHVKPVHKSSIAGTYTAPEPLERVNGDFATVFNPHQGTSALLTGEQYLAFPPILGLTGKAAAGTRYLFFYPTFAYACTIDCMWFFEIYPEGPSRTRVTMNMCFPNSTVERADFEEKFKAYQTRWAVSMDEDVAVLERQQLGFQSDQFTPGRYSHLEPVVSLFANWVVRHTVDRPNAGGR